MESDVGDPASHPYTNVFLYLYFSPLKPYMSFSFSQFSTTCTINVSMFAKNTYWRIWSRMWAINMDLSIHILRPAPSTILNLSHIYLSFLHCIAMRQNAKAIIHVFPLEYPSSYFPFHIKCLHSYICRGNDYGKFYIKHLNQ